jgi:hypothetical protein
VDEKELHSLIGRISGELSYVIREAAKKGVVENAVPADDFQILLQQKEFRDLVIGELYEAYFLPDRHESDWLVLRELLAVVTSEHVKQFVASAAASGVIGNATFAVLRAALARILSEARKARLAASKRQPFDAMKNDVRKVEAFFGKSECAQIAEVESATGIPRGRLHPLLKLLGFKHYRREHSCHWCKPGATTVKVLEASPGSRAKH